MNLIDSNIDLSQFTEPENVHQVRDASRFKKRTLDVLNHKGGAVGVLDPTAVSAVPRVWITPPLRSTRSPIMITV